ncbi:MAG: ribose-phosphate diphosphokinase [Methanomassiliicoccales archaeon]
MIIIQGSSNRSLSHELSQETGYPLANAEIKRFPDRECYIRILEKLEGKDVLIVSATFPDEQIVETLLIHDAVSRMNPASIRLLIPYFGYQRQDKLFKEGEAVSAQAVAGIFDGRFDEILTVDIHAEGVLNYFRRTSSRNFVASGQIARYFRNRNIDAVISPDGGVRAVDYAKEAAKVLNCEYDYFLKERIDATTVKLFPKKMDLNGKRVLVLDDIIATGGSMVAAIRRLKELYASEIYVGCTHGLFIGDAYERITGEAGEVVSTDTVETRASLVSVAPLIAGHLLGMRS